jgi:hypothetical protein
MPRDKSCTTIPSTDFGLMTMLFRLAYKRRKRAKERKQRSNQTPTDPTDGATS